MENEYRNQPPEGDERELPEDPHQGCLDDESGLYHASHFKAALRLELARLDRWERPLSLLVIDLPGLDAPELWAKAGGILNGALRSIDQGARLGRRKLAAIMPDADEPKARRMMMELRRLLKGDPDLKRLKPAFGLALAKPWEAHEAEALLAQALENSGHDDLEPEESAPDCPSPSTAIAADERDLLFDGFKLL